MKKLIIYCCLVIFMFISTVNVFAEGDSKVEGSNSSTKITVSFKAGTGTYTVNGKTVKAQASVVTKGKVFVPVNVITDAIGAGLNIDLKKKTAIITYNDVEIKLTDKKNEAIIAGKKIKTTTAPYIVNSSFMVDIAFLADNLGADYTNEMGMVTFVKEIANPNSIKDFSSLIRNTTKNKVGDSYYKWSMLLPEDLKLDYRDFNGKTNVFKAQDESYIVDVYLYNKEEDASLDNSTSFMLDYVKDYTLIDYGTKSKNGVDYVEFVYKDDKQTYQDRTYLTDKYEFNIVIITLNEDDYMEDKYQELLDSFSFSYLKDGSTEDLSDVTTSGYRKYQDTKLKWSIDVLPEWKEYKDNKIQNVVLFTGKEFEFLSVQVYSLEAGENLDSVTDKAKAEINEIYNSSVYSIIRQESYSKDQLVCNKVYFRKRILNKSILGCNVYIVDKNYKYLVSYQVPEATFNNESQLKVIQGMINSFTHKELSVKDTGKLLDRSNVKLSDKTRKVTDSRYTMDVPLTWKTGEENNDTMKIFYDDTTSVAVARYDDVPLYDFSKEMEKSFRQKEKDDSENFDFKESTIVTEKDHTCYKMVISYIEDDYEVLQEIRVFSSGNDVIVLMFSTDNVYYGTKTKEIFKNMWESFTIK